jgi:hypothetical protein
MLPRRTGSLHAIMVMETLPPGQVGEPDASHLSTEGREQLGDRAANLLAVVRLCVSEKLQSDQKIQFINSVFDIRAGSMPQVASIVTTLTASMAVGAGTQGDGSLTPARTRRGGARSSAASRWGHHAPATRVASSSVAHPARAAHKLDNLRRGRRT